MPDPEAIELDVTNLLPPRTLVLDVGEHPFVQSDAVAKHLEFVRGQDIRLRVLLRRIDSSLVPPALVPVDATGWASRWTARKGDAATDDLVFSAIGTLVSGPGGEFLYVVPGSAVPESLERIPSQLKFFTDGDLAEPPDVVEDVNLTLRPALADS